MFGLNFKKKRLNEEVAVVFDVGSASIGGSFVLLRRGEKPKVLYSVRKNMRIGENSNPEFKAKKIGVSLRSVLKDLEKKGLVHLNFLNVKNKEISRGFCFLASSWGVSGVETVRIKKEEKFIVTQNFLNSIVNAEEKKFIEIQAGKEKNNFLTKDLEIVDKKIIQIKLNGYKVNKPFKKEIKKIEASIFMSFIPKSISSQIKKETESFFHLDDLFITSFNLSYFLSLRDIFAFEKNFIFLDVGDNKTSISFVKDETLIETQTFPFGRDSFIKELMKKMSLTYTGAVSILKLNLENKLDKKTSTKLKDVLLSVRKEWLLFLEKSLLSLSQGAILPKTIFLISENDLSLFLQNLIKEGEFTKLVFSNDGEVSKQIVIGKDELNKYLIFSKEFNDPYLAIEIFFLDKVLKEK